MSTRFNLMKIPLLSLVLVCLLIIVLSHEAASIDDDFDDVDLLASENIATAEVSDINIASVEQPNKEIAGEEEDSMEHIVIREKKMTNDDLTFADILLKDWDNNIKTDKISNVKCVLKNYNVGTKILNETFRKSIENSSKKIVKYMLKKFGNILGPESLMEQAHLVKLACDKKNSSIVWKLASKIFNANLILPSGRSLLHDIILSGDRDLIGSFLYFQNLDINVIDELGNTPLHYASEPFYTKMFLRPKTDPLIKKNDGIDAITIHNFNFGKRIELFRMYTGKFKIRRSPCLEYEINRRRVFEDSFYIVSIEPKFYDIAYCYDIKFKGENVKYFGVLKKEWLSLLLERFFVSGLGNEFESEVDFDSLKALLPAAESDYYNSASSVKLISKVNDDSSSSSSYASSSSSSSYESDEEIVVIIIEPAENIELPHSAPFECIDSTNKFYRVSLDFTGPVEVYKFAGSIMARALMSFVPLNVKLAPSLVKLLFGKSLTFEDLKDDDPIMYRSLALLLEPDYDFEAAPFTLLSDENVMVDSENVQVFLNEKADEVIYSRYKQQIDLFIEGFHSIISIQVLETFFSPSELDEVLTGDLVRRNFDNYFRFDKGFWYDNKKLFFAGLNLLSDDEFLKLLRFATGINGLPYSDIPRFIGKIFVKDQIPGRLIHASACFSRLLVPTNIKNAEELANVFRFAIACGPEIADKF